MTAERALALLLASIGAGATLLALMRMPLGTLGDPGPGLLPFVLGVVLTALAAAAALLQRRTPRSALHTPRIVTVVAILVGYPLLLPRFGFAVCTALALFVLGRSIGSRPADLRLVLYAVLVTGAAIGLFRYLLRVPLPRGPLGW